MDIYVSRLIEGAYSEPTNLDNIINTPQYRESCPCIAPDENFLIFTSDSRQFSADGKYLKGRRDLMISFKGEDGNWTQPINMDPAFNADGARFPGLSPDGKNLFFTRYVEGPNEDIFWVNAKIIETYKPDDFK